MTNYVKCAKCTDEDLNGMDLPAEGMADWTITKATSELAKSSGDPKTIVTYKVRDSKGNVRYFNEHVPMMVTFRVARIGSATGTSDMVKEGNVDIDQWVGKSGKGKIKHTQSEGYDKKAEWSYFVKPSTETQFTGSQFKEANVNPEIPVSPMLDDEIPF